MCDPLLTTGLSIVAVGGILMLVLVGDRVETWRPGWGLWTTLAGLAVLALPLAYWLSRVAVCF